MSLKRKKEKKAKDDVELKQVKKIIEDKSGIIKWDFKLNDEIPFFDSDLSYELTGYRPVNEKKRFGF